MIEEKALSRPQNISLKNCKNLEVSGVKEVISFDEEAISLETDVGRLEIRGEGMKINSFDTKIGDIMVSGYVYAVVYTKSTKPKSVIKRFFS